MDLSQQSKAINVSPDQLVRYSFVWSNMRLIIAAVALFMGGIPPVLVLVPFSPLVGSLLTLCWIISGLAAGYLGYRWWQNKQMLFGGKDQKDTIAFVVMVISGLNLGITGLAGNNIGMSISSNRIVFVLVGIFYIWSSMHLQKRWNHSGKKMF